MAERMQLPTTRQSIVHHFAVGEYEGYLTVGLYETGLPGEVFVKMVNKDTTVSGFMDSFGLAVSLALQHGVPLKLLCDKFSYIQFDPKGETANKKLPTAKSLIDYLFRWMDLYFIKGDVSALENYIKPEVKKSIKHVVTKSSGIGSDAPPCRQCGELMQPNGSCHVCKYCGETSGCS